MTHELCFCFWYYLSSRQKILGLAARAYYLSGSDHQKGLLLSALARSDHRTQDFQQLPARLVRSFPSGVPYEAISQLGVEEVFADQVARIVGQMPPDLPIPEEKFFYAQPMFDFGHGFLPCEIGDGFIRERQE